MTGLAWSDLACLAAGLATFTLWAPLACAPRNLLGRRRRPRQ